MNINLYINPIKVLKWLLIVITALAGLDLARVIGIEFFNKASFLYFFALGVDSAIPTWYASISLFVCSILLYLISCAAQVKKGRFKFRWRILSGIFLGLSVDEVATIHEWIGGHVVKVPDAVQVQFDGFLNYSWIIVGILFIIAVFLLFLKPLLTLPKPIQRMFLISGLIYVGGAIFMEMINGRIQYFYTSMNAPYQLSTIVEEYCEMLGIVLFIYALLRYLVWLDVRSVQINLHSQQLQPTLNATNPCLDAHDYLGTDSSGTEAFSEITENND